ncbi:MAG: multidrug transporter [Clostridia bacterium]
MNAETKMLLNLGLILVGVLVSALSQILLKKAALKTYDKWIDQYLNPLVMVAYFLFFSSSLTNVIAFRVVPLSYAPIWNAAAHVFVTLLAFLMMKERPGKRKLVGLLIILAGIVLFSLQL